MKKINITVLIMVTVILWAQPAMAYIDPGSGSAIMSAIIGLFVALGIVIKTYWYKLKSLFTSKKIDQQDDLNQKPVDKKQE